MTTEQWRKLRKLFEEALELEISARADFLATKFDGDDRIRTQVIQMLQLRMVQSGRSLATGFAEKPQT